MHKYNLNNLKSFKPRWNTPKTKVIRVPENLANQLLEIAHNLDNNKMINISNISLLQVKIKELNNKIESKEKGYKSNSASPLIKDIKNIFNLIN